MQALREHRRYIADMQPLLKKYDVLLTAGFGPAPRFEDYRVTNFWRKSNAFTPSNTARTPSLVLGGGFSKTGLPLGLQIITRPYNDAQVLAVGHAYQQATDWPHTPATARSRRKSPCGRQPACSNPSPTADAATRAVVETHG